MIYLLPTTENLVILSLKEKVTISAPYYYLFRFVNKATKEETACIAAVIDEYDNGRESFEIETVSSGADNLAGQIVLTLGDEYDYYIYAQESATNLNYALANEMVEQGLMRYGKTITPRTEYEREPTTRKSYKRA